VDGEPLLYRRRTWVMLHKPAGYLSATEDGRGPTVLDLLPPELRVRPVSGGAPGQGHGGLLLLTNDGQLAHDLLSPRHHVDKVYYVRTAGRLTEADCAAFEAGMTLATGCGACPPDWRS
jgi:16S rRNA pseudouridine516 synthase